MSLIIDGSDRGGGPASSGRTGTIDTFLLGPDEITLGLGGQLNKVPNLSISGTSIRGAETIEFGQNGVGAALERVQQSQD